MDQRTQYPKEVYERAVRMVFEHQQEYFSQWAAIRSISEKFGMTPETLRRWVRTAETDEGRRPASRPMSVSGSRVWSAKSKSCVGPTRS